MCGIFQTAVLEDGCLAADDGSYLLTVKGSIACTCLYLVVESQNDRTAGADICSILGRVAADECRLFTGSISQHEDLSNGSAVIVTLHTNLGTGTVGHPANPYTFLVIGFGRQTELLRTVPSTCWGIEFAYLSEVCAVDRIFHIVHAIGVVVIANTTGDDKVLIALRRKTDFKVPFL